MGLRTGLSHRSWARSSCFKVDGSPSGSVTFPKRRCAPVRDCLIGSGPRSKWKDWARFRSAAFQLASRFTTASVKARSSFARCPHESPTAKQTCHGLAPGKVAKCSLISFVASSFNDFPLSQRSCSTLPRAGPPRTPPPFSHRELKTRCVSFTVFLIGAFIYSTEKTFITSLPATPILNEPGLPICLIGAPGNAYGELTVGARSRHSPDSDRGTRTFFRQSRWEESTNYNCRARIEQDNPL